MQGMTIKSIKHHTALQPLFIIMGAGIVFVCAYIGRWGGGVRASMTALILVFRLASKTTDVNWTKAKDIGDHMGYYNNR